MTSIAVTMRLPGARTAPASNNSSRDHVGRVNRSAKPASRESMACGRADAHGLGMESFTPWVESPSTAATRLLCRDKSNQHPRRDRPKTVCRAHRRQCVHRIQSSPRSPPCSMASKRSKPAAATPYTTAAPTDPSLEEDRSQIRIASNCSTGPSSQTFGAPSKNSDASSSPSNGHTRSLTPTQYSTSKTPLKQPHFSIKSS